MKINRENFLRDLSMVKAGLSPREFIEQSSCLVFQNGQVMTFNDEVACRKEIEGLNFTGAIQANSLFDILEKLEDPELEATENDRGELEFRGKRKKFGITKDAEIFLPIDKVEIPSKWHKLPEEFTEAIKVVQHCVSTDESKFLLTCVHLHPDHVEACDNLQIMRVRFETGLPKPMLARGTSIAHVADLEMNQIAMTKAWIHFKNEKGLMYSCRRHNDEYPILDKLIQFEGHPIKLTKGLAAASDRAAIFAMDKSGDPLVKVTIKPGMVRVMGQGLTGWYKEVKKVTYEGPAMEFVIAPDLLKYISEKYTDAQIIQGKQSKLKVVGGSWEYVTVLGRPEEDKKDDNEKD